MFKKIDIKQWILSIIGALILACTYPIYDFISDVKVHNALEIVHENTQKNQLDTNTYHLTEIDTKFINLNSKIDTNYIKNQKSVENINISINKLTETIKELTYVVKKNNKAMKSDLDEIKKINNYDLTSK